MPAHASPDAKWQTNFRYTQDFDEQHPPYTVWINGGYNFDLTPLTFRQSATDADNNLRTDVAAVYVQDQVAISSHLQLIGGLQELRAGAVDVAPTGGLVSSCHQMLLKANAPSINKRESPHIGHPR